MAQEPDWVLKSPASSPTAGFLPAMAYDAARGQVVLFGGVGDFGFSNETWVWDGINWTQKWPANSPAPRWLHAMAYDAARRQVVLFGGSGSSNVNGPYSDTWVWDGVNWTQKSPANSPTPRAGPGMAYDAARGQVVLFGGYDNNYDLYSDTWVWDGTNWTQKSPANSPTPREDAAIAYDAARGQVVLFGGVGDLGFNNDTWVWDGINWTQKDPANSATPRVDAAIAYDAARGQMVLFGGLDVDNVLYNDTWVWDGTNWTQKSPANSPTPRDGHAMAYDAAWGQAVLFGGNDSDDTWVWPSASPLQTSSISVTTNLPAASFTITGPATYSGSGTSFSQANAPVGSYTITYGQVSGYSAPSNETKTLAVGGTIAFTGNYQATSVGGQTYTAVELVSLPGASDSQATAVNNSGLVVGFSDYASGAQHAFLYSAGTMIDLGTLPGGSSSQATGINDRGQVVGFSNVASGASHAFLFSGGTIVDLAIGGEYNSVAFGVNNGGQIAGYYYYYPGVAQHAFLYSAGTMIDLGTPPGDGASRAQSINDSGQIAGASIYASGAEHAFLYSAGTTTDLGTLPGATFASYANGINDSGQVVGNSSTSIGVNHAFLYSGGTMTDLGMLVDASTSYAEGINNNGQVVGSYDQGAFLYSGGTMIDLNSLVTLPGGAYLTSAAGINDLGQIAADGSDGHVYLLTPGNARLTVVNPFAPSAELQQSPPTLSMPANMQLVLSSPRATSLAADGQSAVVLAYQSKSPQPVTFILSARGISLPTGKSVGSLAQFDPNYLVTPSPPSGNSTTYTVSTPTSGPDAGGDYVFLALLWGPNAMPLAGNFPVVHLAATAMQQGQSGTAQASISLKPPPLLLVHGVWSSAKQAGFTPGSNGFYDWMIPGQYPHNLVSPVDYSVASDPTDPSTNLNSYAFNNAGIQGILLSSMTDALAGAAEAGMAARSVDVVAHSMGGLVTRYFMSKGPPGFPVASPELLPNPVHRLITIGTPHQGSKLTTALDDNLAATARPETLPSVLCSGPCSLANFFLNKLDRPVGGAIASMEPGSEELGALSSQATYSAIVGLSPVPAQFPLQITEPLLNWIISGFLPGETIETILSTNQHDTIVPGTSQSGGLAPCPSEEPSAPCSVTIPGIVHTNLCWAIQVLGVQVIPPFLCPDSGETESQAVWSQAYYWLTGGTVAAPATGTATRAASRAMTTSTTSSAPSLNLSGYTQVPASNVAFLPTTGSTLTINSASNITVTSSTKTIAELLLLQAPSDSTDTVLLYSTQSPFTISFVPTRLGSASFVAIAVFSDSTYSTTTLNYTLLPGDTPYALNLVNAPVASMNVEDSRVVQANALSPSGQINVTQVATYTVRSGSASVFSVSAGGTITANGNGVDFLDVSYGGVTATAQIPVGACTYALNPTNQIVPSTGGTVTIQVSTQSGCAWTASGGAAWLPLAQASGSGNGSIALTASANGAGGTQGAIVYLDGLQAVVTQPATACTYGLSQTQINAPAAGASGTITATTSCPVTASSNQSWLSAAPLGTFVQYTVAPNNATSQRSATLTVGSVAVPVTQGAFNPCDLQQPGSATVADVQLVINGALGAASGVNDLNGDGIVSVVDVQIEINAALSFGCTVR